MLWQLQWGSDLDFLVEVSLESGRLMPALENKPQLHEGNSLFWDAFIYTSSGRNHSLRFGKENSQRIIAEGIPLAEIAAYCDLMRIDDTEQRMRVVRMVTRMDQAYLKHVNRE